jgi:hypothetical protein
VRAPESRILRQREEEIAMTEAMRQEAMRALLALEAVNAVAPDDVQRHQSRIRFSLLVLEGVRDDADGERRAFAQRVLGEHVRRALDLAASLREPELATAA